MQKLAKAGADTLALTKFIRNSSLASGKIGLRQPRSKIVSTAHCSQLRPNSRFGSRGSLSSNEAFGMKTYPVYLNGKFVVTEKTYAVKNPANGQPVARMSAVEPPAVGQAIQQAHEAFLSWREVPAKARGQLLHSAAAELTRRREDIARLIT